MSEIINTKTTWSNCNLYSGCLPKIFLLARKLRIIVLKGELQYLKLMLKESNISIKACHEDTVNFYAILDACALSPTSFS